MLAVNKYPKKYVDQCRARAAGQIAAYHALAGAAEKQSGPAKAKLDEAVAALQPHFFNNMVITLDGYFMHRTRGLEGKDGNPLNEVRMLAASLMASDGVMTADKTIKYDAAKAVAKCALGEAISLDEKSFKRLAAAYFAEIESRFG